MDPLTHFCSGVFIAELLNKTPDFKLYAISAIAAILPDIDFLISRKLKGTKFINIHHGLSHSFVGNIIISIVYSLIVFFLSTFSFKEIFLLSFLALNAHSFLDIIQNNNGLIFLFPFYKKRISFPLFIERNPRTIPPTCGDKKYFTCFKCQFFSMFFNPFGMLIIISSAIYLLFPVKILLWISLLLMAFLLVFILIQREIAKKLIYNHFKNMIDKLFLFPARDFPNYFLAIIESQGNYYAYYINTFKRKIKQIKKYIPDWNSKYVKLSLDRESVKDFLKATLIGIPLVYKVNSSTMVKWKDLSSAIFEPIDMLSLRIIFNDEDQIVFEEFREKWN